MQRHVTLTVHIARSACAGLMRVIRCERTREPVSQGMRVIGRRAFGAISDAPNHRNGKIIKNASESRSLTNDIVWLKQRCLRGSSKVRIGPRSLAWIIAFALLSCQSLRRADNSDGLLDFVLLAAGRGQPDIAFVEKVTIGADEVLTARVVVDGDCASVRGSVGKRFGAGWVSSAYAHLDIIVFNSQREVIQTETATFSPPEIAATVRGIRGRSHFSAIIRRPTAESVIRVVFHSVPGKQCQFYEDSI